MTFNRFFSNPSFSRIFKQNKKIIFNYFFILLGFFLGNLCGSFLYILPLSTFCIIISIVLLLEIFTFVYYKFLTLSNQRSRNPKNSFFFSLYSWSFGIQLKPLNKKKRFNLFLPFKLLYFIKIGLIFGLFVDAFKVGS